MNNISTVPYILIGAGILVCVALVAQVLPAYIDIVCELPQDIIIICGLLSILVLIMFAMFLYVLAMGR